MKGYFRGWVDVQNQGVQNDYAYYVAPTDDIPFPWLTIALAGTTEQRTYVGMFEEKNGVVRSRSNRYLIRKLDSILIFLLTLETSINQFHVENGIVNLEYLKLVYKHLHQNSSIALMATTSSSDDHENTTDLKGTTKFEKKLGESSLSGTNG